MKCEDIQFNLSLYTDDILTDGEKLSIENHLPTCPLCRQKLSEFKEIRNNLRLLSPPVFPTDLLQNVRSAVANQTKPSHQPMFGLLFTESPAERIRHFLMPSGIATLASLVIGFSLFFLIESPQNNPLETVLLTPKSSESTVLLANSNVEKVREELSLPTDDFENITLTNNPPSINPTGAFVALTKSFVRGKMKDEEVVIIADVFSNGIARVAEVVEPSRDKQTMSEIRNALEKNPDDPSFLPASADKRSEKVTFILKIQRVDVVDQKPNKKAKR